MSSHMAHVRLLLIRDRHRQNHAIIQHSVKKTVCLIKNRLCDYLGSRDMWTHMKLLCEHSFSWLTNNKDHISRQTLCTCFQVQPVSQPSILWLYNLPSKFSIQQFHWILFKVHIFWVMVLFLVLYPGEIARIEKRWRHMIMTPPPTMRMYLKFFWKSQ